MPRRAAIVVYLAAPAEAAELAAALRACPTPFCALPSASTLDPPRAHLLAQHVQHAQHAQHAHHAYLLIAAVTPGWEHTVARFRRLAPGPAAVAALCDGRGAVAAACRLGVRLLAALPVDAEEVRALLRAAEGGRAWVSPRLAPALLDLAITHGIFTDCAPDELTADERRIATMAREGLSNKQIACRLGRGPDTIKYHLAKVYRKLGIRGRRQLGACLPGK